MAGKRAGLVGERSGLFMEQVRIVKEMRARTHGQKARYMVWENVCFDADTLVTCDTGYKRIEDVAVGNLVKTMSGRYMPVMKVFRTRNQKVIRLKVSGAEDLIVTPNHPFWAREKTYPKGKNRKIGEPKWVRADELTSRHMIAYKADTPSLPDVFISECEAFALGRWLADGSVDIKKSTPRIFISCGLLKADETEAELRKLPWDIHKNQAHKTAVNFCFTSAEFYGLIKDAGRGAGNKSVPSFVFNLPIFLQKEVLRGYTSGDGYIRQRGNNTEYSASTASRKLAYGIARLIRNVYRVAANISVREPKDGLIGCRVLHANYPSYNITASLSNKVTTGYDDGEFIWQCVKGIEPEEEKRTVFNLSVHGDNTYGANDVVVHNCGAFSSNQGKDFQAVLTEIVRIAEPEAPDVPLPEKGKWTHSGCLMGESKSGEPFSVAWRLHDAQYWGVPQRRKRVCVCADFNGLTAGEILFSPELRRETEGTDADQTVRHSGAECGQPVRTLPEGLPGDSEPGKEERERTAGGASTGIGAAGKCLNGWDVQSKHIQPADGIAEALYAGECRYAGGESYVFQKAISSQERAGKPGGGKGILIQDEHVGALSMLNNQSVFCLQGNGIDRADTAGCNGRGWCEDVSYTLNTIDRPAVVALNDQGGSVMNVPTEVTSALRAEEHGHQPIVYNGENITSPINKTNPQPGDPCHTLSADSRNYVVEPICVEMTSTKNTVVEDGISPTLTARMGTDGNQVNAVCMSMETYHCTSEEEKVQTLKARDYKDPQIVTAVDCRNSTEGPVSGTLQNTSFKNLNSNSVCRQDNVVRRLTPLECERLQMMPDGWTDIGVWVDEKGRKRQPSDSPRYKAIGNSIALPFWAWLMKRISAQYERPATLGSLFDGVGMFPLAWARCNGADSCRWVSEIENFPIAVSKRHFGDEDEGTEGDIQKYL